MPRLWTCCLQVSVASLLAGLRQAMGPAGHDGASNAWILKSVDMSRGRGISMLTELKPILEWMHAKEYRLIAQRYVERPMLIRRRKFDIRKWVLLTSVNPLSAWHYTNVRMMRGQRARTRRRWPARPQPRPAPASLAAHLAAQHQAVYSRRRAACAHPHPRHHPSRGEVT